VLCAVLLPRLSSAASRATFTGSSRLTSAVSTVSALSIPSRLVRPLSAHTAQAATMREVLVLRRAWIAVLVWFFKLSTRDLSAYERLHPHGGTVVRRSGGSLPWRYMLVLLVLTGFGFKSLPTGFIRHRLRAILIVLRNNCPTSAILDAARLFIPRAGESPTIPGERHVRIPATTSWWEISKRRYDFRFARSLSIEGPTQVR